MAMNRGVRDILLALAVGIVIGVLLSSLESTGLTLNSVLSYGVMSALLTLGFLYAYRRLNPLSFVCKIAVAAILLRLIIGVGLSMALPHYGYAEPQQQAGYIFRDAFVRDRQAWEFVEKSAPVNQLFNREEMYSDQYGGMLAVSAGIYKTFSADQHRPWLIILLAAFASGIAVLFLGRIAEGMLGQSAARWATSIYAFYPEAVLLGGSQMRDPILMLLITATWFFVNRWRDWGSRRTLIWAIPTLILLAFFSYLVAAFTALTLFIWWWTDYSADRRRPAQTWGWLAILALTAVGVYFTATWLQDTLVYEKYNAVQNSGMVQAVTRALPESLTIPFLTAYGLFQPVLPAAIFDDAAPLWRAVTTFKAAGWYLLLPLLAYIPFALRKAERSMLRRQFAVLALLMLGWLLLSSVRGAGDMWDNPRYRTIFLPYLAALAAWGILVWRNARDGWLPRLYLMMSVFVAVFSAWYAQRKLGVGLNLPFAQVTALTAGLWLLIILWGIWRERKSAVSPR